MKIFETYTDAQLLDRTRLSDEAAFTEIYERYWDKLFVVAAHRLGAEAEAKELVQNVFLNFWKRRTKLQVNHSLSTYLGTAIKYEVLNALAAKGRMARYQRYREQNLTVVSNETENQVDFHELQEKVAALVKKLPEKCRIVFELRQEGMSQKDIANTLDISEKTVEAHMSKALRHLKTGLTPSAFILLLSHLS